MSEYDDKLVMGTCKFTSYEENKELHRQVDIIQKKLQERIDKDCGQKDILPLEGKPIKFMLDNHNLKDFLKEHLSVKVETDAEMNYHYDGADGHKFNVRVSILFDNEEICADYSTMTT